MSAPIAPMRRTHLLIMLRGKVQAFTVGLPAAAIPSDIVQMCSLVVESFADKPIRPAKDRFGVFLVHPTSTIEEVRAALAEW